MIDCRKFGTHRKNRKRSKSGRVHQPHITVVTVIVRCVSIGGREKEHVTKVPI